MRKIELKQDINNTLRIYIEGKQLHIGLNFRSVDVEEFIKIPGVVLRDEFIQVLRDELPGIHDVDLTEQEIDEIIRRTRKLL